MSLVLDKHRKLNNPFLVERPAWIPDDITEDWDTDPYAYQTEAEQMPKGHAHATLVFQISGMLGHIIEKRDLMFLGDSFALYRDPNGIKQRVAPDLLVISYQAEVPYFYDMDVTPPPLMVIEVTSPDNHVSELEKKSSFYFGLGIPTYLLIDAVTPDSKLHEQIDLHLWKTISGKMQRVQVNQHEYCPLPGLGIGIKAKKQELFFKDLESNKIVRDAGELARMLEREQQTKEVERQARIQAEKENADLRAEIERLRKEQGK